MSTKAFDFVAGQAWAMEAGALRGLLALAERDFDRFAEAFARAAGDPEAVRARDGDRMRDSRTAEVRDGVAVVPVRGPISRYATMFSDVCGGTSTQRLATDLRRAADDPKVKAVLLDVDSPGGQAAGIGELAAQIRAVARDKPVCAYVGGMGCSAAYWLSAACSEVVCHDTATLGSIGTILQLDDKKRDGERTFVSSQSPMKRPDLTSKEGAGEVQQWVDALSAVFIRDVAAYRGATPEKVLSDYGRGGVKVGAAAVAAGMADACGDFETTLARLSRGEKAAGQPPPTTPAPAPAKGKTTKGASMNLFSWLKKNQPEAAEKFLADLEAAGPDAEIAVASNRAAVLAALGIKAEPTPPARTEDQVRAEIRAEFEAKQRETLLAFYGEQASAWFDGQVAAGTVLPAAKARTVALYVDAALADNANGPVSFEPTPGKPEAITRLSALTSSFAAAEPHSKTVETVGDDAQVGEMLGKLKILAPAGSDATAKDKDDEVVAAMLARLMADDK